MKHTSIVSCLVIAISMGALPARALAQGPRSFADDKKAAPQPPATAAASDTEYRLGAGDKLRIEVYKDTQLSQSVQIRPDGKITLPLVGDIDAAGRTSLELRDTITRQLKEYMTNPVVTVIVVEASAAQAFVVGEVNHPGPVALQSGQVTVLQALAMAGGLKDFANSKNIRILRRTTTSGLQTIAFNYKEAIRGAAPVFLRPGDTIVVPD